MLSAVHEETVKEICQTYEEPAPKDIYYMGRD